MTRMIVRMSGTGIPAHLFQNLRLILGYRRQISGNQVIINQEPEVTFHQENGLAGCTRG
jgi:hypothetical protein